MRPLPRPAPEPGALSEGPKARIGMRQCWLCYGEHSNAWKLPRCTVLTMATKGGRSGQEGRRTLLPPIERWYYCSCFLVTKPAGYTMHTFSPFPVQAGSSRSNVARSVRQWLSQEVSGNGNLSMSFLPELPRALSRRGLTEEPPDAQAPTLGWTVGGTAEAAYRLYTACMGKRTDTNITRGCGLISVFRRLQQLFAWRP